MKLLYCRMCSDVFNLQSKVKRCGCGRSAGRYVDEHNAIYNGQYAMPFAIDNSSFFSRLFDVLKRKNPKAWTVADRTRSEIYDNWHGVGKIQCWIMQHGKAGWETIKKVPKSKL